MKTRLLSPILLIASLLLGGCASSYNVRVDALRMADQPAEKSYTLTKGPEVKGGDLFYNEVSRYVMRALETRGYSAGGAGVNYLIEVDYGMAEPQTNIIEDREPIYDYVGGGYRTIRQEVSDGAGGTKVITTRIHEEPRRVLTGYRTTTRPVTIYPKYLSLTAYNPKKSQEYWKVSATTRDRNDDIRFYIPIMTTALINSIDSDSGRRKTIRIKEDDAALQYIRTGVRPPAE